MTTVVICAYGTRGDVAPLTGLAGRLRDNLPARVVIAALLDTTTKDGDHGY